MLPVPSRYNPKHEAGSALPLLRLRCFQGCNFFQKRFLLLLQLLLGAVLIVRVLGKEARSKVIDGILASRTDCKECKPVYEKYQKIFFKKTKEKFKQEHSEVARYEKAAAYLAKHPDDKDSTQKELQQELETLLSEIAELKVPLTEVQEDLKKLRDIRYWVRKATPGTEESKEPPKKQPIKEVLQDKADEKKAQRTAPAQTKHKQQNMEL